MSYKNVLRQIKAGIEESISRLAPGQVRIDQVYYLKALKYLIDFVEIPLGNSPHEQVLRQLANQIEESIIKTPPFQVKMEMVYLLRALKQMMTPLAEGGGSNEAIAALAQQVTELMANQEATQALVQTHQTTLAQVASTLTAILGKNTQQDQLLAQQGSSLQSLSALLDQAITKNGQQDQAIAGLAEDLAEMLERLNNQPGENEVEQLTVTGLNTLSSLSQAPADPRDLVLSVNGQDFSAASSPPAFTVSGTTIIWTPSNAGFNLEVSDRVIAHYQATPI